MKKMSQVSLWIIILCSIGFGVGSIWIWTVDEHWFRPSVALFSAISLYIPRILFYTTGIHKHLTQRGLYVLEQGWLWLMLLNTFGSLSLYTTTQYYDMVVHTIDPIIGGFMIALLFASWEGHDGKYETSSVLYMTLTTTFVIIFLWEGYEYSVDQIVGTKMFGQMGEDLDTVFDIVAGCIGLFVLRILIQKYLHRFLKKASTT